MTRMGIPRSTAVDRRWVRLTAVLLAAVLLLALSVLLIWRHSAGQDREINGLSGSNSSQSAQVQHLNGLASAYATAAQDGKQLARGIKAACASGALGGSICQSASSVAAQPIPSGTPMPGPEGRPGPPGATGPSGAAGAPGRDGANGPTGAGGAAGSAGPVGPQGSAGPTGPAGPQGSTGPQGPQGPAGADGRNASPQTFVFTFTVPGPPLGGDRQEVVTCIWGSDAGYTCTTRES